MTSGYSQALVDEGRHGFELIHKACAAEELSRVLRRVTATLKHNIRAPANVPCAAFAFGRA